MSKLKAKSASVQVYLPEEQREKLRVIAFNERTTKSSIVEKALTQYFKKLDQQSSKETAA